MKLLRLPQVLEKVGFKKSKLWQLRAEGKFPEGFLLTPRIRVWEEEEIDKWIKGMKDGNSIHQK